VVAFEVGGVACVNQPQALVTGGNLISAMAPQQLRVEWGHQELRWLCGFL
jgi:hypothetical protein